MSTLHLLLFLFCIITLPLAIILLVEQWNVWRGKKPSRWEMMQMVNPNYKSPWKWDEKKGQWKKEKNGE
jgi:hypothetical protein